MEICSSFCCHAVLPRHHDAAVGRGVITAELSVTTQAASTYGPRSGIAGPLADIRADRQRILLFVIRENAT